MNEVDKRKIFQRVKGMTNEQFWVWFDQMHTRAYVLAVEHMQEAMSCHKRISRPMINQVMEKAEEVRELWVGARTVTASDTEMVDFEKVMGRKQNERSDA